MTTVKAPPVTMHVTLICTGRRMKYGAMAECGWVIFKGTIEQFEGRLEFRCPKCYKVTVYS